MAAAYQSHATVDFAAADATFIVPKPSGLAEGDGLIAFIVLDGVEDTLTASAGWTLIEGPVTGETTDLRGYSWERVATAGDVSGSGWTFTHTGTTRGGSCIVVRVDGNDQADLVAAADMFPVSSATTADAGPITTTADDQLVLYFAGQDTSAAGGTYSWSGGTEFVEHENAALFILSSAAWEVKASAGSTTRTATTGIADQHVTLAVAIKTAGGVAVPVPISYNRTAMRVRS